MLIFGRITKSLEQLIEWRGKPKAIRCDNGPECISHLLREWAQAMDIEPMYIQPSKPTQNAYIERFNRAARNEWLNLYTFDSIEHAQSLATQCIITNDLIVQLVEFHQESYLRLFKQRRFYF